MRLGIALGGRLLDPALDRRQVLLHFTGFIINFPNPILGLGIAGLGFFFQRRYIRRAGRGGEQAAEEQNEGPPEHVSFSGA